MICVFVLVFCIESQIHFQQYQEYQKKTDIIVFEWKSLKWGHHNLPLAYFSEKNIDVDDYYGTEYWLLSYKCLETVLNRNEFKYFYKFDDPSQNRSILVAGKNITKFLKRRIWYYPDQN